MFTKFREENAALTLHAEGNRLLNAEGKAVRLTGVNCVSLLWLRGSERIAEFAAAACDRWEANTIRLPLSQDRWFGFADDQRGIDETGLLYRKRVDQVVETVAARGKYVILDLHQSNCNCWNESFSGALSDMNSLVFWKAIAIRYGNHPNVLFDLYNEPYQVSWDLWKNGGQITIHYRTVGSQKHMVFNTEAEKDYQTLTYQAPGMQKTLATIRAAGAKNMVVVGGLDWSYDLTGIANGYDLDDCGGNGFLLDAHLYPCKELDKWDDYVTVASDLHPILIGECGHYGEAPVQHEWPQKEPSNIWVPKFLKWVDEHEYHITAWDFHDHAGPSLVQNMTDFTPTSFWGAYYLPFLQAHAQASRG